MCLITLAGWFSPAPVTKKIDPRSIFLIPTPPWINKPHTHNISTLPLELNKFMR